MRTSPSRTDRRAASWLAALLLVLGVAAAAAQDEITVSTAEPDMTEQGTYDLEVMVGGDNFPSDAEVEFFVTGTEDPGGITVKKVKRQGPKNLKVTVDVAGDAQFQFKFDIQVRSRSNGRSGKGTELFRVLEKDEDTTPPGAPIDLHVVEVTYNTVSLAWTMPADDGYEAGTGPVEDCRIDWDPQDARSGGYECVGLPNVGGRPWPNGGEQQICQMACLDPETTYHYRVKCVDDSSNWSSEAQVAATTRPFGEFQDPSWTIEEVPIPLDVLVGHGFDGAGDLVIAGVVGLWNEMGGGRWAVLPTVIRVITGRQDEVTGQWSWSYEDVPGFAHELEIDPQGRPAFSGAVVRDPKNFVRDLVFTYHDGVDWRSEVVATESSAGNTRGLNTAHGFAFDPAGHPAIAWCSQDDTGGLRLARRDPSGQWSIEQVSQEECSGWARNARLAFDDSGRPAISYRVEPVAAPATVNVAIWSGQDWLLETVCSDPDCPDSTVGLIGITPLDLIYDPVRGGFSGAADNWQSWIYGCDRLGAGDWQCTAPVFGQLGQGALGTTLLGQASYFGDQVFEADGAGEMFIAHSNNCSNVVISRRLPGESSWTQEHVDHLSSSDPSLAPTGPCVALDPSGVPTLTWTWNLGQDPPTEHHLFFAWKTP